MPVWRRNISSDCATILRLAIQHTQEKDTHGETAAGIIRKEEGRKHGKMDGKKRYDGSTEALRCQNPCSVVGFVVMLIDAWLFASGVTVNTKKTQERRRQR